MIELNKGRYDYNSITNMSLWHMYHWLIQQVRWHVFTRHWQLITKDWTDFVSNTIDETNWLLHLKLFGATFSILQLKMSIVYNDEKMLFMRQDLYNNSTIK